MRLLRHGTPRHIAPGLRAILRGHPERRARSRQHPSLDLSSSDTPASRDHFSKPLPPWLQLAIPFLPSPHAERLVANFRLRRTLESYDLSKQAIRIASCGLRVVVHQCDACGVRGITQPAGGYTCDVRLCSLCWRRIQLERWCRFVVALEQFAEPKLLTLSVKNFRYLDKARLDDFHRSFYNLRRREIWKGRVRAGLTSIEFTWSEETGWNLHMHLIIDAPFIPQRSLQKNWGEVAGGKSIAYIEALGERPDGSGRPVPTKEDLDDVLPYLNKEQAQGWPGRIIAEYVRITEDRRLTDPIGDLRGVRLPPCPYRPPRQLRDWFDERASCSECGGFDLTPVGTFHVRKLPEVIPVNEHLNGTYQLEIDSDPEL